MPMTDVEATNVLATTPVIALSGVVRVRADGLDSDPTANYVDIYEETVTATENARVKVPAKDSDTGFLRLTAAVPSIIMEGYGNYKFVTSQASGIEVGYVAG